MHTSLASQARVPSCQAIHVGRPPGRLLGWPRGAPSKQELVGKWRCLAGGRRIEVHEKQCRGQRLEREHDCSVRRMRCRVLSGARQLSHEAGPQARTSRNSRLAGAWVRNSSWRAAHVSRSRLQPSPPLRWLAASAPPALSPRPRSPTLSTRPHTAPGSWECFGPR